MKREIIPRPLRACLWTLLAVIVAIAYYIALGCPTLSLKQEFRRAENAHMVGPSKIVDRVPMSEYSEFKTMLVGETDQGITFFGQYGAVRSNGKYSGSRFYCFSYQNKAGDVSFAAPPIAFISTTLHELPVYVFTENKEAVRATVSITVSGSRSYNLNGTKVEDSFNEVFTAEADRDKKGFFRFDLTSKPTLDPASDPFGQTNDSAYALLCLSALCNDGALDATQRTMVIPITVTLYDKDGNVILTRELILAPYEGVKQA